MAFFSKAGNILRQTVSKNIKLDVSASNPSIFQFLRCMSTSKIFIGGLAYATDDTSLREAFIKYGEVIDARVIVDRESGRSRGFGFVTYTNPDEASAAIQALDGQDLHGRTVRVNYANERERSPAYGSSSNYGGGYGGGGGGGNYGGGGGYGGGNYGGGGGYGGGNYGGGGNFGTGGNYGRGDNYASGNNYGSGSSGSYGDDGKNFGGGGGGGGSGGDVSGGVNSLSSSEYNGNAGSTFTGGEFGNNESKNMAAADEGYNGNDPTEGKYRDDDDDYDDDDGNDNDDGYANRKA